ncbi:MAG: AMIN domain-containing protein [Proteobacteria bacterium]|nr:AMIN domain-containing protein [Pseudomonadota bacterium]
MKKSFVALAMRSLFALLLACTVASAEDMPEAPRLQKLTHTTLSPTSEQVILQLNGSYSPKVFTLKDENPRLVFDFDGMTYGRDIKGITTATGSIVKRVRVARHEGDQAKTRIVFDLTTFKGLNYTQKFDENNQTLVVQFTGPGKAALPQQRDKAAEPKLAKGATPAPTGDGKPLESASGQPQPPAEQPITPEPAPPTTQAASPPTDQTATDAPKQPMPGTAEAVSKTPFTPIGAEEIIKQEKVAAPPETAAMKPSMAESADRGAVPPPETATVSPAAPSQDLAAATAKPEEPEKKQEKLVKQTVPQPAPDSKKEKKAKAAQTQATPSRPEAAAPAAATAEKKAEDAAPEAGKSEATDKPALLAKTTDKPQIEYVKFDDSSPKGEMILFKLNGFHPPAIHGVEEGIPRVICDFNNTKLLQANKGTVTTSGKFIKAIRTTATKKPEKVRVVIDLEPNRSYDLQQVFFKEDNLFVLIVNTVKR